MGWPVLTPPTGDVHGRLSYSGGADEAGAEPVVIYLDPLDRRNRPSQLAEIATIRQRDGAFSPLFLVVVVGQKIRFRLDDGIYHRIFSYSKPNVFDLAVGARDEPRTLQLLHPGVVNYYCSLHPRERGTIVVAPSPFFDVVHPPDSFEIRSVPSGRYRLRTLSEAFGSVTKLINVQSSNPTPIDILIERDQTVE
jgi:plastocyanin